MLLADSHISMVVGIDVHVTTPPVQPAPALHRDGSGRRGLHTVPGHERQRQRS